MHHISLNPLLRHHHNGSAPTHTDDAPGRPKSNCGYYLAIAQRFAWRVATLRMIFGFADAVEKKPRRRRGF